VLAIGHRQQRLRVGDHHDQRLSPAYRVRRARPDRSARLLQRRYPLRRAIPDADLAALAQQPVGDRRAHRAEPDDSDPFHAHAPFVQDLDLERTGQQDQE
jgi:hypothetical protein